MPTKRDVIPELVPFGNRIKELRKVKDWTQEELSERCGLERSYISGVEAGRRNIALLNINSLAQAFEMTVSELFDY